MRTLWIPLREVISIAQVHNQDFGVEQLHNLLKTGEIRSRAAKLTTAPKPWKQHVSSIKVIKIGSKSDQNIRSKIFRNADISEQFWFTAKLDLESDRAEVFYEDKSLARRAEGLSAWREDIERLWSTLPQTLNTETQVRKSGRPPEYDWADVYLELSRLLYNGDIDQKTKLSEIESIVTKYIEMKYKKYPSESTIRERVRVFLDRVVIAN